MFFHHLEMRRALVGPAAGFTGKLRTEKTLRWLMRPIKQLLGLFPGRLGLLSASVI